MQIERCHFKCGPVGVRVTVNIRVKVSIERLGSTLTLVLPLTLTLTLTRIGSEAVAYPGCRPRALCDT